MKYNSLPRAAKISAIALTVALGMSACGASNESNSGGNGGGSSDLSGTLSGAGSTAQEAAMAAWKAGFQGANSGTTVNYDAVGSGGGREQFLAGGVQFAGSDDYLSDDELTQAKKTCGGDPVEVPVYVSPIAVIYNLPDVSDLKLSPATLGKIMAGTITSWDDAAITADNPSASLPSSKITPVHRSDESGTTANFTDYLSQAADSDWTYGSVETWPIKGGEAADGTSGVVSAVKGGEGTIGYADASQAGDLGKALIGQGGDFVGPTAEAASKVLDESTPVSGRASTDLAITVNRTPSGAGIYPIVLVSYQMYCSKYDAAKADLVKAFASYVISADGQSAASSAAGSAPISDAIRQKAQAAIDTISAK